MTMRRLAASTLVLAMSLTGAPLFAAGPARVARQAQTGTIAGTAQGSEGQRLASYTVRVRNLANGNLAGSTISSAAGQFSFAGLNPGNYAIEVVNAAGEIVGTSAVVAVTAGATVSLTVTASAVTALGAAGGASAAKRGISTAVIITSVAAAAGVAGVVATVNHSNASPSR